MTERLTAPDPVVKAFRIERCPACGGSGLFGLRECVRCAGIGQTYTEVTDHRIVGPDVLAAMRAVIDAARDVVANADTWQSPDVTTIEVTQWAIDRLADHLESAPTRLAALLTGGDA